MNVNVKILNAFSVPNNCPPDYNTEVRSYSVQHGTVFSEEASIM